jgi:hypothetical protein
MMIMDGVPMSRNEEFKGQLPECSEGYCNLPADHIHLDRSDVDAMLAYAQAGRMAGAMDHHMRTAPTDVRDHAALKAHMLSSGHYANPLEVHDMDHATLKWDHDRHHAEMDKGPEDEREKYTNFDHEHMHND